MKDGTIGPVVALAAGVGVDYGIYVYATMADATAAGFKMREAYLKTLNLTPTEFRILACLAQQAGQNWEQIAASLKREGT